MRAHHFTLRGLDERVTSACCAANRTSTSPSSHRMTSLLVRSVTRAGVRPVGSALVLSVVRVLLWMKSGSFVAVGMVRRVFMDTKSGHAHREAPARQAARSCTSCIRLHSDANSCMPLQEAAR